MRVKTFWKPFLLFLFMGVIGLISILPSTISLMMEQLKKLPDAPNLPPITLGLIGLVNPLILLIIAVTVGNLLSKRVGLTSALYQRVAKKVSLRISLIPQLKTGVVWGSLLAIIFTFIEFAIRPWLPVSLHLTTETRSLGNTIAGVLYGGIVEELLLRWGLMTLFVWIGWRIFQRRKVTPTPVVMWISIVLSSVLFAIAHIGVTSLLAPLTPIVILRMILLNGIAGTVFGWLYWKTTLEVAMVAHGMFHIVITLIVWIVL